jgi:hypothetical protein
MFDEDDDDTQVWDISLTGQVGWKLPDPRELRMIGEDKLVVSQVYQRETPWEIIKRTIDTWNPIRSEALTVAPIDGGKFQVIEGQRRTLAAQQAVRDGIAPVGYPLACVVLPDLSTAQRAGLVKAISTGRRSFDEYAKWKSDLAANDAVVLTIRDGLAELGVAVGSDNGKNTVRASVLLRTIAKQGIYPGKASKIKGAEAVKAVYSILMDTWDDDTPGRFSDVMTWTVYTALSVKARGRGEIGGVGRPDRLVSVLGAKIPAAWLQRANRGSEAGTRRTRVYNVVADAYNGGLPRTKNNVRLPLREPGTTAKR